MDSIELNDFWKTASTIRQKVDVPQRMPSQLSFSHVSWITLVHTCRDASTVTKLVAKQTGHRTASILRRVLHVIYDEHRDRTFLRFEFQSQLFPQSLPKPRSR